MTAQLFVDLINLEVFGIVSGLGIFSFVAGHASGTTVGFTRKITHSAT